MRALKKRVCVAESVCWLSKGFFLVVSMRRWIARSLVVRRRGRTAAQLPQDEGFPSAEGLRAVTREMKGCELPSRLVWKDRTGQHAPPSSPGSAERIFEGPSVSFFMHGVYS
jgi:hypothetical protein